MKRYLTKRSLFMLAILTLTPGLLFAFKPRFQSALQSYTFNNAGENKATLFFHVTKSIKKEDSFRDVKVASVGPHERKDGSKAINYDSSDTITDFALSVEYEGRVLGTKQLAVVGTTNNPHEGSLINPNTEKIFVSVINNPPRAIFVVTDK